MPEFSAPRRIRDTVTLPPSARRQASSRPGAKTQDKPAQRTPQMQNRAKPANSAKRTSGRRRGKQNMTIYYAMCLLAGIVIFSILSATVLFNLDNIVVSEGDFIYSSDEIIAAAGIIKGENLLRFDAEACRRRIKDSLVYIDSVTIRKSLPNKLIIEVVGAEELANIEHGGKFYIISGNGRILAETNRISENTVIYGAEANGVEVGGYFLSESEKKGELVYMLMEMIDKTGLTDIVSIDITDAMDIKMNYMNRIELYLGPATQLEQKLRAAAGLLETEISSNERGALRLIDPVKVVFQPETTTTPFNPPPQANNPAG